MKGLQEMSMKPDGKDIIYIPQPQLGLVGDVSMGIFRSSMKMFVTIGERGDLIADP